MTLGPTVKVPLFGDALHLPMGSITRSRARKLKKTLNVLMQVVWAELEHSPLHSGLNI